MLKPLCVLFSVLFVASLASAEVFKCVGKNGEDLYQNFPCQFESGGGMPGTLERRCPAGAKEITHGCRGPKEINRRARRAAPRHDDR